VTSLSWEALEPLLRRGEPVSRVVALLRGAAEAERRRCSKQVMAAVNHRPYSYRKENLLVAAFGCGPEGGLRRARLWLAWLDPDRSTALVEVLADRNPSWLGTLAEALLDDRDNTAFHFWFVVNRLVRAGLVARPEAEGYAGAMVRGLIDVASYFSFPDAAPPRPPGPSVAQRLRADPELLGSDLDALFVSESAARALQNLRDDGPEVTRGWLAALTDLAADGTVDRGRLLDGVLTALAQDWATGTTARWYLSLWRRLETLVDELAPRQARLGHTLSIPVAGAVTLALKELERLARSGRLDQAAFVEAAAPALYRPEKEPVLAALRLLDRCAAASPALADAALACAALALAHDRLVVQERALRLLTKRWHAAGEGARDAVAAAFEGVNPTLREAVAALLAAGGGGAPPGIAEAPGAAAAAASEQLAVLAARAAGVPARAAARLGLPAALAAARAGEVPVALPPEAAGGPGRELAPPPADTDELADLFTRLLERVDEPLDLERAMAALARLGPATPTVRARAGALVSRAEARARAERPFMGRHHCADAAGLAIAWLNGRAADPDHPDFAPSLVRSLLLEHRSISVRPRYERDRAPWDWREVSPDLSGFASTRAWEVAKRVSKGVTGELLAMPTHDRGGVDPRVLVERVARAEAAACEPGHLDLVQALLRTAGWDDGDRAEARAAARSLTSPAGMALRRALGDPDAPAPIVDRVLIRAIGWAADGWADTVADLHPVSGTAAIAPSGLRWYQQPPAGQRAFLYELPPSGLTIRLDDPVTILSDLDGQLAWWKTEAYRLAWGYAPHADQLVAARALACPAALELVVAHGLPHLNHALSSATAAAAGVLDPLAHAEAPLGPVALTAIALGTGGADAKLRALTADVLVQAAADGRLDGAALGGRLAELLVTVDLKPARVAATLRTTATASALAAARTADCLVAAVPAAVKAGARDAHRLVELLAELLAEHGRAAGDALRSAAGPLVARGRRNRLATEATRLLALTPRSSSPARSEAARQAVEALIERASSPPID
jgi:hypothetical protein